MSQQTQPRETHFWRRSLPYILLIVAFGAAFTALFYSYQLSRRDPLVIDDDVSTSDATALLERANDALNSADRVLSWLEGASVLLGFAVAAGAWMLRNSVQDQVEAIRAENELLQQRLTDREEDLAKREEEVNQRLNTALSDSKREIDEAHARADRLFRLLNNLVLAEQQVRAQNHASALRILTDAYALEPTNYAVNYLLGYLYSLRSEYDRAIEYLEKSLSEEEGFAPAIAALGLALRRKGDSLGSDDERAERNRYWSQAESRMLAALTIDPALTDAEGESYYGSLGGLYRRQARYPDAIDAYRQAERVTPTSSYPMINLASLTWHQGQIEQAQHYFERVKNAARLKLDSNPLDNWARADYAQALLILGEQDKALEEIETVCAHHPVPGLLATVRSGLRFLADAPQPIAGLDALIAAIDRALSGPDEGSAAQP